MSNSPTLYSEGMGAVSLRVHKESHLVTLVLKSGRDSAEADLSPGHLKALHQSIGAILRIIGDGASLS